MLDPHPNPAIARLQELVHRHDGRYSPAFMSELRDLFAEIKWHGIPHIAIYLAPTERLEFAYAAGHGLYQTAFLPLRGVPQTIDQDERLHGWWKFWEPAPR